MSDFAVRPLKKVNIVASAPQPDDVAGIPMVGQAAPPPLSPPQSMNDTGLGVSPWVIFGGIFVISSIGGIAALLRGGQEITRRDILSAALNSGMVGLVVALTMWSKFGGQDPYLLIGVSVLAGLGGATTIDFAVQYFGRKFGIIPLKRHPTVEKYTKRIRK